MFSPLTALLGQTAPAPEAPPVLPQEAPQAAPGASPTVSTPTTPATGRSGGMSDTLMTLLPFVLILVFMYLILVMPQRKEKKRRESMIAALKRGDRVITVGGIQGTVIEVSDAGDVVLKVDESNNTKIKFSRAAIQSVLSEKGA